MNRLHSAPLMLCILLATGCSGNPSAANIELRKENQALRAERDQLLLEHQAALEQIRSLESEKGTLPTLPQDRLNQLFIAESLSFGRLTGGADLDPLKPGDEALKVYICPLDSTGDPLKSAGSFVVSAFDLTKPDKPLIGTWEFTLDEARKNWFGDALLFTYVLTCPWKDVVPASSKLTVTVDFSDALTGRTLSATSEVAILPPGAAQ